MKRLLILFTFAFSLISCRKDEISTPLVGEWKWVKSTGGIAGITTESDEKNQRTITFSSDGNYKMIINNTLAANQKYTLIEAKSIFTGEIAKMIQFEGFGSLTQKSQ